MWGFRDLKGLGLSTWKDFNGVRRDLGMPWVSAVSGLCEYRLQGMANIRALSSGIGFWGPLCYSYNKEPPK